MNLAQMVSKDTLLYTGFQINVSNWKLIFLFLNQNICCGHSKEPSQWDGSFEHPKYMLKLMGKKIIEILRSEILLNWSYVCISGDIVETLTSAGIFDIVVSNPPYIPTSDIDTLMPEVYKYVLKAA